MSILFSDNIAALTADQYPCSLHFVSRTYGITDHVEHIVQRHLRNIACECAAGDIVILGHHLNAKTHMDIFKRR